MSPKQVVGFTCVFNSEVDQLIRKLIVNVSLLQEMLNRYRLFDERREDCIKRSRDVQKNAKNAIYALQRGSVNQSKELLN